MSAPSISQIYGAFVPESHRVFRAAMRNSSSGVLRVDDLIKAIVAAQLTPAHPELDSPSELLDGLCHPAVQSPDDRRLVPMSNEPALRQMLERAWWIAAAQCRTDEPVPEVADGVLIEEPTQPATQNGQTSPVRESRPRITPACLAASALIQRGRLGNGQARLDAFSGLGLWLPACLQPVLPGGTASVESISRPRTAGQRKAIVAEPEGSVAEWMDQALELWLQLQPALDTKPASPGLDDRAALKRRLAELVQQIEAVPGQ